MTLRDREQIEERSAFLEQLERAQDKAVVARVSLADVAEKPIPVPAQQSFHLHGRGPMTGQMLGGVSR